MTFIKQLLIPYLLECPPNGLDIIVMVSNVRMFHIHPVREPFAHFFPFVGIFPDGFFAFFDERLYSVLFDILLAVKPEFFFYLEFYGKPVRIPARLS